MIQAARIAEARARIDPVFRESPQFVSEPLSELLGLELLAKIECMNPIRSFKGRGASWLCRSRDDQTDDLVCASAGNFGQGMAFACRSVGRKLVVYAALTANPLKIARMRALGAEVRQIGHDFDEAKDAARMFAQSTGAIFIEDGAVPEVSEGAGTIAAELTDWPEPIDYVLVPVGGGALIHGVAAWFRAHSPQTRIIGVVAEKAPSMYLSWQQNKVVTTARADTIADGIAIRVPIREAVVALVELVHDILVVTEEQLMEAARLSLEHLGLIAEPAGSAGIAGILARPKEFESKLVAVPICGGNVSDVRMMVRRAQ